MGGRPTARNLAGGSQMVDEWRHQVDEPVKLGRAQTLQRLAGQRVGVPLDVAASDASCFGKGAIASQPTSLPKVGTGVVPLLLSPPSDTQNGGSIPTTIPRHQ